MLDIMPGIEITLWLISWVAATHAALTLWDWCNDPQESDE